MMNISVFSKAAAAFAAAVGLEMSAGAATYPTAGGDISTAAGWGGSLPAATEEVEFASGGTYTASQDAAFKTMKVKASTGNPAVFDLTRPSGEGPMPVVTLSPDEKQAGFTQPQDDSRTILRGGTWNLGGGNMYVGADAVPAKNRNLALDGGAVVTNVVNFYVASREGENTLTITNAAQFATTVYVTSGRSDQPSHLRLGPGGRLQASTFNTDASATSNSKHPSDFLIDGAGAVLKAKTANLANCLPVNSFVAANGALLDFGTAYYGGSNTLKKASNSRIVVRDGARFSANSFYVARYFGLDDIGLTVTNATLTSTSDTVVGYGDSTRGNFIDSLDSTSEFSKLRVGYGAGAYDNFVRLIGGTATVTTLNVGPGEGACGNSVLFSNVTASVNFLAIGAANAVSNRVTIAGPETDFVFSNDGKMPITFDGEEGVLHITDGASVTNSNTRQLFKAAASGTICVDDGATWKIADPFHIGYTGVWDVSGPTNRFIVGPGGNVKSSSIFVRGVNTELIVDGGSVSCAQLSIGFRQYGDDKAAPDPVPTNCAVIVKGAASIEAGAINIGGGKLSRFVFVPDAAGWTEAPMKSAAGKSITLEADTVLSADPTEFLKANPTGGELPLMTAGTTLTVPDAVIEAANARFEGRCSNCSFYKDGKTLYLSAKPRGSLLLVR